jgi:phage terminase small subunit
MEEIKVDENTLLPTEIVEPKPHLQMEFEPEFWRQLDVKLKPEQERFAQFIVQGKTATEAYYLMTKECKGKELNRKTCTERGCRWLNNPDIVTRIQFLHRAVTQQFVMSDVELHKHLTEIIRNKGLKTADRINAIKVLAQIKGLANPDTQVNTTQHFVNLQVEVVDSNQKELKVINGND